MFTERSGPDHKTVPLLTYWTRLYVPVLLLSLLIMAIIAGVWIKVNMYNQRYDLLELRAEQMAEEYGQKLESGVPPDRLQHTRTFRTGEPTVPILVQIADQQGNVYTVRNLRNPVSVSSALQGLPPSHQAVLGGKAIREQVEINDQTWLRVGVPVYQRGEVSRALYLSIPTRSVLQQLSYLYVWLALITVTIGLAGWLVLYILSRKLTLPLRQMAAAAQSVACGTYDPDLPRQLRERELQQLVVSFRDMAAQLKKLERLRSDLLAGVSHELRTPVTSIRGMIQAVQGGVVSGPEAEEFLRISLDEAKRLQNMVEELLDFSSLEAGAAPMERDPVDLPRLVDEVIQQVRVLPEFTGIRVEQDLPGEPAWLAGDAGRIRQILLNLLNNSLKASARDIKISLRTEEDRVTLDVQDNGKGIAPEDRPYIFERFYRGAAGKAKPRGLGLGLTVSRLLARAHGGDLILLETSADGTTFRLILPPGLPGRED